LNGIVGNGTSSSPGPASMTPSTTSNVTSGMQNRLKTESMENYTPKKLDLEKMQNIMATAQTLLKDMKDLPGVSNILGNTG